MEGQTYCFELQTEDMDLAFCMGPSTLNLGIPQHCVDSSVKILNTSWKGQIEIPEVRKIDPDSI